jgi:nucleoside-diphosphate-sugar epimerase
MGGIQGVVHAAAHLYGGLSLERVREVNVMGTARLLEGAALAGASRVVHISSVAVFGNPPGLMDERVSPAAPLRKADYYGRSKREGEEVVRRFHGRDGMEITVLRPPALFGERDRTLTPRLAALAKRRLVFLLGGGRNSLALAYAGNVAQAVERALEGKGSGQVFNVTEDVPITQRALVGGLARELGSWPVFLPTPGGFLRVAGRMAGALGLGVPGSRELSLSRTLRLATRENPYPCTRAYEVLGWNPPYSLPEALARTGEWLRERKSGHGG